MTPVFVSIDMQNNEFAQLGICYWFHVCLPEFRGLALVGGWLFVAGIGKVWGIW